MFVWPEKLLADKSPNPTSVEESTRTPAPALVSPLLPVMALLMVCVELPLAGVNTVSGFPAVRMPPVIPPLPDCNKTPPLCTVRVCCVPRLTAPPLSRLRELTLRASAPLKPVPVPRSTLLPALRLALTSEPLRPRTSAPEPPSVVAKAVPTPVAEASTIAQGRIPLLVELSVPA